MHVGVHEAIQFKLDMVIDATALCILILVLVILTLMSSHRGVRKDNFCTSCLTKFPVSMDGS